MMSSLVSQGSDAESLSHRPVSNSSDPVLLSSGTFRTFSPSRRLFCLLTAFDFLATLFIWILYAHAFTDFKHALREDVFEYKFKSSLFDIVLLALWRMIILLLAYALFLSRKWYAVAVTTAITTAFLLVKVVLMSFKPQGGGNLTLYYLLVLSSLILSWVESWVLDVKAYRPGGLVSFVFTELMEGAGFFEKSHPRPWTAVESKLFLTQVIPTEIKVEQRGLQEQRRSLLADEQRGHLTPYSLVSDHSFYTPEASDSEIESDREDREHLPTRHLSQKDQEFVQKGKETIEITWQLMGLNDGWKSEKVKDGIVVESRVIPSGKKIYRLKSSLDAKAEDVFNLVILHPEDAPKWGGNVTHSCVVRQIDEHTDIVYNSTGEAGGGMVASRDFVNLRRWEKRGDVFVSCNVAVECEEMPPKKEHVRGTNGPGGWAIWEAEGNPNRTEYVWLFNVDLKGWLPQSVIDAAMSFMLYSTGQGLKAYVQENLGQTD